MIAKNISAASHSNADVSLLISDNILCVLKQSNIIDHRFSQSIQKQKIFQPITLAGLSISAAQILREETSDEKHKIIMRYANGISGADFAIEGNREIAGEISRGLTALLVNNMSQSIIKQIPKLIFLEKFNDLFSNSNYFKSRHLDTLNKVAECINALLEERDTIATPVGPCHGDLTLSNIILSQSQGMILIDFLPTFLESPLQDLAKISQDLEFGWSFRRLDKNLRIKSQVFSNVALPSYARHLYALFPLAGYLFKILCLARIAPYITDPRTAEWLDQSLKIVIHQTPAPNTL